jgi:hypothetical protein
MPGTFFDHITVTASSLEAGIAFVRESLGVSPQVGGEHPRMATHNLAIDHPNPGRAARLLSSLTLDTPVSVLPAPSGAPAHLVAHIDTSQGRRILSAP